MILILYDSFPLEVHLLLYEYLSLFLFTVYREQWESLAAKVHQVRLGKE